jgi:hypothetical protein
MLRKSPFALPAILCVLLAPGEAHAAGDGGEPYPWLAYAGLGLAFGGGTGLAGSYLLERRGHGLGQHPTAAGAGLGAIAGLGLGLVLGAVDRAADVDVGIGVVASATALAACGALLGGIGNASYDFFSKVPLGGGERPPLDHAAFPVGAAWGTLIGVTGALVLTLVDMVSVEDPHRRRLLVLTIEPVPASSQGRRTWVPALAGRY